MGRSDVAVQAALASSSAWLCALDTALVQRVVEHEAALGRSKELVAVVDLGCPLYRAWYGLGLGPFARPRDAAGRCLQAAGRPSLQFVDPALASLRPGQQLKASAGGFGVF